MANVLLPMSITSAPPSCVSHPVENAHSPTVDIFGSGAPSILTSLDEARAPASGSSRSALAPPCTPLIAPPAADRAVPFV